MAFCSRIMTSNPKTYWSAVGHFMTDNFYEPLKKILIYFDIFFRFLVGKLHQFNRFDRIVHRQNEKCLSSLSS
jgi:hypothetical protein